MITPEQAQVIIMSKSLQLATMTVSINEALNRVLTEDLHADSDLPPFDRVMMDGIAVRFEALQRDQHSFEITGIQRAGGMQQTLVHSDSCLEVMTGAICPLQADTVIPYEHLHIENDIAMVLHVPDSIGKNIHCRASDKKQGDKLVSKGKRMGAAEIGIAASIGKVTLEVVAHPRVLICSTGDELVAIENVPEPHQIRRSNVYALQAMVQAQGWLCDTLHLPDDESQLQHSLSHALQNYEVILMSGGVSKGKFDLVPDVLQKLGVEQHFHRIAQKPGKPMWFGSTNKTVVFAFPGNPVSTLVCAARYLLPWIQSQQGRYIPQWVEVKDEITLLEKLTQFIPVGYLFDGRSTSIEILRNQGSGDFSALSGACGFIEVPSGAEVIGAHSSFRFFPLP